MRNDSKFHWAEGMKYALEGMKTLFILNGASAISILTFVGNTKTKSALLVLSMTSFGAGALIAALLMAMAYFTQLQYGNNSATAHRTHYLTYICIIATVLCFMLGLGLAAFGLWPCGINNQ
jgi:hypothetical protein